ncbi:hypothetical protein PoB_001460200 [Plakobranchus ocellatus]|uniref:Uncharacterized protein n=1 Tax=Plakobranchus ocellatus TaxID=259542 RepID=A0AAV3YYQ0_9GAST|nr:hypothetical protein PoB_001460200 [Plakobranchus ocellatus]
MDPIFGLPCVQESRAMDSARTRNQSQDKLLAEKFESLDLAMKTRSGQLLTQKSEVEDFMSRLDTSASRHVLLPAGLSHRERSMYKKMVRCAGLSSMTLAEFDRALGQRIAHTRSRSCSRSAGKTLDTNSPSQDMRRPGKEAQLESFHDRREIRTDEPPVISTDDLELCLPMNRQKHAVRDAWSRIISDDMRHKMELKKTSSTPNASTQSYHRGKEPSRHGRNDREHEDRGLHTSSHYESKWKLTGRKI